MIETDYLVVGSGVAGLTYAIKIAERFPNRKVIVLTKTNKEESNTRYAQGGVAIVQDFEQDSFQKHIDDTLIAGSGRCDIDVVTRVVEKGPQVLKELLSWGASFDTNNDGKIRLCKEGGHSAHRIVHHKDITGYEISRTLIEKVGSLPNVKVLTQYFVVDLLSELNVCKGAFTFNTDTHTKQIFSASYIVLATGGIGSVYGATTNPSIATGDGIAMAKRIGAKVKNMHFVQFHPTALFLETSNTYFLITEAIRGAGAILKNNLGERFMTSIDPRAELAPRDIVARAIYNELQKEAISQVYLDCTGIEKAVVLQNFPNINAQCKELGLNLLYDWIPIQPVSHYVCGGIDVDRVGATNIQNLYACGECAHTGLHGANRLASNSLLEALVYADSIFEAQCNMTLKENNLHLNNPHEEVSFDVEEDRILLLKMELNQIMMNYVAIIRTNIGLSIAQNKLFSLLNTVLEIQDNGFSVAKQELLNMIAVAQLIVKDSIAEKENCGGFYNSDYKNKSPLYKQVI